MIRTLLGTTRDCPIDLNERFWIMFYRIVLLGDTVCIRESHNKRRIPSRAEIGIREYSNQFRVY